MSCKNEIGDKIHNIRHNPKIDVPSVPNVLPNKVLDELSGLAAIKLQKDQKTLALLAYKAHQGTCGNKSPSMVWQKYSRNVSSYLESKSWLQMFIHNGYYNILSVQGEAISSNKWNQVKSLSQRLELGLLQSFDTSIGNMHILVHKEQHTIATSICEAQYRATLTATLECVWPCISSVHPTINAPQGHLLGPKELQQ